MAVAVDCTHACCCNCNSRFITGCRCLKNGDILTDLPVFYWVFGGFIIAVYSHYQMNLCVDCLFHSISQLLLMGLAMLHLIG